jgi:1-acyl-sn-glycerol-3-phosphate acyltransferase
MGIRGLLLRLLKTWISRRIIATVGTELPSAPFIVTANHTSYFDHFIIGFWLLTQGLPYPRFLSKAELFENPLSAWFNRLGGGIPLARGQVDTEAFAAAKAVLDGGGVFIMYAEGTRSRDGWLRAPRRGIATLAAEAGVPVVPIGLLGVNQIMPIGKHWPRRKRRIVIHSGSPLAAPQHGKQAEQEFVREVFQQIAGLTAQWPGFVDEPHFAAPTGALDRNDVSLRAALLVERGFRATDVYAPALFRMAVKVSRGSRSPFAVLERGRAYGQLAGLNSNPLFKLWFALASKRAIWRSLPHLANYPLAWHVWASLMEQLPAWLGGDERAAQTGHRMAAALDSSWPRSLWHVARLARTADRVGEADRWMQRMLDVAPRTEADIRLQTDAREMWSSGQLDKAGVSDAAG